jgi:alpha-beta hydrolase superfamily lysophospholipase
MQILKEVIERAESVYPEVPLFLYGHSMGANLVLNYALRNQLKIAGIVATSPYLGLAFRPPKWKMVLGKLMLKTLPMVTLPSGLDPKGISRIPEEVEKYRNDPLIHDKVSPMFSFPVIEAGEWAIANATILLTDTLLVHGTGDPIIDFRATEEFHRNSNKTEIKLFDGGFHELHYDVCQQELIEVISEWLKQRIV